MMHIVKALIVLHLLIRNLYFKGKLIESALEVKEANCESKKTKAN